MPAATDPKSASPQTIEEQYGIELSTVSTHTPDSSAASENENEWKESIKSNIQKIQSNMNGLDEDVQVHVQVKQPNKPYGNHCGGKKKPSIDDPTTLCSKHGAGMLSEMEDEMDDEALGLGLWGVEHVYAGSGSGGRSRGSRGSRTSGMHSWGRKNNSMHFHDGEGLSVIDKFSNACPSHIVASTMCICFMVVMTLLGMVIFHAGEKYTLLNDRLLVLNERLRIMEGQVGLVTTTLNMSTSYSYSFNQSIRRPHNT